MIRTRSDIFVSPRMVASALTLLLISMLSACSESDNSWPTEPVAQEQENYQARARSHYTPPGPPEDPWGPYIAEASERFDIPEAWIRAVMHQESGGRLYDSEGHFITSTPGAMGLMQVMPPAYDDLRIKYDLGPDPYDPHDNIMAGTAYMRQMYDIYGSPGFLAAYNYGPGSLDHYLRHNRALRLRHVTTLPPSPHISWASGHVYALGMTSSSPVMTLQHVSAAGRPHPIGLHTLLTVRPNQQHQPTL